MEPSTIQKFHEFVQQTYKYDFGHGNLLYLSNGMGGEAGEVQNEVKKLYRALNQGKVQDESNKEISLRKDNIKKEIGDVLWYLFAMANELEVNIEEVIQINMNKNNDKLL
tara:strand:- start:611 stop:940 length:330 start_codon:yes stop_codon:yes gene_type:complete